MVVSMIRSSSSSLSIRTCPSVSKGDEGPEGISLISHQLVVYSTITGRIYIILVSRGSYGSQQLSWSRKTRGK